MIDTLIANMPRFIQPSIWDEFKLREKGFLILTLHRPANVDEGIKLKELMDEIILSSRDMPLIFPVHPRTRKIFDSLNITPEFDMIDPVGYFDMIALLKRCSIVLTDSGGLQKEAFFFSSPCVTLRDQTEWVELVENGFNMLAGANYDEINNTVL